MIQKWIGKIVIVTLIIVAIVSAASYITMLLWNWLMPEIFGLIEITFWQAAGLLLLSKILIQGFGKGKKPGHHHHGPPWKRWHNKWHNMSDDQRENLKRKFADKWCHGEEPKDTESEEKKNAE